MTKFLHETLTIVRSTGSSAQCCLVMLSSVIEKTVHARLISRCFVRCNDASPFGAFTLQCAAARTPRVRLFLAHLTHEITRIRCPVAARYAEACSTCPLSFCRNVGGGFPHGRAAFSYAYRTSSSVL